MPLNECVARSSAYTMMHVKRELDNTASVHYRAHKKLTSNYKALNKARCKYINSILQQSPKEGNTKLFDLVLHLQSEECPSRSGSIIGPRCTTLGQPEESN